MATSTAGINPSADHREATPLDVRLEELLAKQSMLECLYRYCRGVDHCDVNLIAAAFHDDAHIDMGNRSFVGAEAGRVLLASLNESPADVMCHFATNHLVSIETSHWRAMSESRIISYSSFTEADGERVRLRGFRYLDTFERRGGAWRISRRVAVSDFVNERITRDAAGTAHGLQGERSMGDPVYWALTGDTGMAPSRSIDR